MLSSEKTTVDLRGGSSGVLVSDDILEINQIELLLGKLGEFSPEYAA
jgi:hypothetical protein